MRGVRYLLPAPSERANLFEAYSSGFPSGEGAAVRVNMISSLDGATAVGGRSGALGGPSDRLVFSVLRSLADVVLVGSGTARAEGYGPVELPDELRSARQGRGQTPVPPVAVVTQSANLDWGSKLFTARGPRAIVIAPGTTPAAKLAPAARVADVLTAGAGSVDLAAAVQALAERGLRHVLCEGGPMLAASLARAGLVDELCLTLSPKLAGSAGDHLVGGWLGSGGMWLSCQRPDGEHSFSNSPPLAQLVNLELVHLLEDGGYLFLRMRKSAAASG